MTKARIVKSRCAMYALLVGALVLVPLEVATAWQTRPSRSAQFQQATQQQQTNSQLQQNQLQSKLRQGVSDNARRPGSSHAQAQKQADQADKARHDRERAADQDLVDRQRDQSALQNDQNALPRVLPNQPVSGHGGG